MKRTLAILLVLVLGLSSSIALASEASGLAEKQQFRRIYADEVETWNYLYQSSGAQFAPFVDGLIQNDIYGIPQPCVAESWEVSEDGTVYTFHIRPGIKWYTVNGEEYGEVTAHDFEFTGKMILDPDYGSKTSDIYMGFFKNAEEYFNKQCDWADVGIKALDDYTLQYTLIGPISYFLSNLTYVCFLPANEKFVTECGDKWGTSNEYWLYNGAFIMTEFEPQVGRVGIRNENYWDKENVHLERIEYVYNAEAYTLGPVMAQNGEVDFADIQGSIAESWMMDPELSTMIRPTSYGSSTYSYWYEFNFWPTFDESVGGSHETWMKCVNNKDFRKSFFHALDRIPALETSEPLAPETKLNNTITLPDFVFADGVSYSQMGDLAQFTNTDSYNPELAMEYKAKAMEALAADGVTFPVKVFCPYNTNDSAWTKRAQVVEQQMESLLGTDYIDIVIEGYPSTDFLNATRRAGNFGWGEVYWGADYADPATYCDPFRLGQKYNYMWYGDGMAEATTESDPEGRKTFDGGYFKNYIYENMYNEAIQEQVDLTKRYTALANLEAWLIDSAIVIPYSVGGKDYISARYNPFEMAFDPFGVSDENWKYIKIYNHPMGMDEYDEALTNWLAARDAALEAAAGK